MSDPDQYYSNEMPRLVTQQTIDEEVERWVIELKAVNALTARTRARAYARRLDPGIRNALKPEIENTEQSTFSDVFPERFGRDEHRVELLVMR